MATSFITGDRIIGADATEADASVKHYTPGPNEATVETPDEVDRSPIDAEQRQSLDKKTQSTFQSPMDQGAEIRDRAPEFVPPQSWISPVVKQRQRQAMTLPSAASLDDLDQRIRAVTRFDGMPKQVASLAQKARLAIGAAREAHEAARHGENPRFAVSVAAKDEVVKAIATATTLVGSLECTAEDPEISDEWFAGLTANLDKQRADALKALRAAEKAYASLRASIGAAQALATGPANYWDKSWHSSVVTESDLNAPIAAIREAISFLDGDKSDDYTTGEFLTTEYEGIPPHTLAKLKRGAEISQPGSFAAQVYMRALNPHPRDRDALEAIETKRLVFLTNSAPLTSDLIGKRAGYDG